MAESTENKNVVQRAADVSGDVIESLEARQQASIDAVRKFANTLDDAVPNIGDPAKRKAIIDAALDMADMLGTTQYEFLRSVVRTASEAVGGQGGPAQD